MRIKLILLSLILVVVVGGSFWIASQEPAYQQQAVAIDVDAQPFLSQSTE
jgi:hypothetical protein